MSGFDAFYWPGGWDGGLRAERLRDGSVLRSPDLDAADLAALAADLRTAGAALRQSHGPDDVIRVVDRVAQRFIDPADPLRREAEALLPPVTGYSAEMIRAILDRMPLDWRARPLERLLLRNFPDPGVLSALRPAQGGHLLRAYPPELIYHHLSGNVPGVGVTSIVRGLLLRSASLARASAREPVLPALFARALAEEDEGLGSAVATLHWPHDHDDLLRAAADAAEAVVVYGSDEAVDAVRSAASRHAHVIAYRHRVSLGYVSRGSLADPESASAAALAVSLFDQQGCVSPHLVFVEAEASSPALNLFLDRFAAAFESLSGRLPRGTLEPGESAAIREARDTAVFEELAGEPVRVIVPGDPPDWMVIVDPRRTFQHSCLNRVVRVIPVTGLDDAVRRARKLGPMLQTVGVAAAPEEMPAVAEGFGGIGAVRVVPLDRAPWPAAEWHHDGRPALADLVRWCEVEPPEPRS